MKLALLTAVSMLSMCSAGAFAEVKLPAVFSDNMVLQRGMPIPVWGWASPGEKVAVHLGDAAASAVADKDGNWRLDLPAQKASADPLKMTVEATNNVTFDNVLIGDVWVASGQSNMQFSLGGAQNAPEEVAAAGYPRIRLFTVPDTVALEPQKDVKGQWVECTPQTARGFSAVAYFFGRDLQKALDVPIGLIHTSWGGTPAESWTSREALAAHEELAPMLQRIETAKQDLPAAQAKYEQEMKEWEAKAYFTDPGNKGFGMGWASPQTGTNGWTPMDLPGYWESKGLLIDGVVWFRKEVQLPESWAGRDLTLSLGPIDDCDTTYFNGTKVGAVTMDTPNWWLVDRRYDVPGSLVKAGRAVIAVRVFDRYLNGGFGGMAPSMSLSLKGSNESIPLAGQWFYKIEVSRVQPTAPIPQPQAPLGANNPWTPTGLYNAMIAPLVPYAIEGAIWYQGESNADRAYQYRTLFPVMIEDWRKAWGEGDFPFLFVQLANFMPAQTQPAEASAWAELREAQLMALKLPKTGMAVILDVGEAGDIHPKDKQTVGARLALAARAIAYGQDVVYSGPVYDAMKVEGNKAVLSFKHVGSGLEAKGGGELKGFAIAGADKKFVWADAQVVGDTVVCSSPDVAQPAAVRYDWANNPIGNFYNKEGLPATPFRTDDWPGVTDKNR
jgi:sialate O-acetylesterase